MESLKTQEFVIIGGTTKSGTSSLFNYLSVHPALQGSSMKETRFFLDEDYPVKSKYRHSAGLERYLEFFQPSEKKIFLEATPDYLYSRGTPLQMLNSLPEIKWIFILRNPVDRFLSWYNFNIQNGTINKTVSLQHYFEMQLTDTTCYFDQHLMTLIQGKYSMYLKRYLDTFGEDKVYICYMEDLKNDPLQFMVQLCDYLGIESSHYKTYHFEIHNATNKLKNQKIHKFYLKASYGLRKKSHNKRIIHGLLKKIKNVFFPVYLLLNGNGKTSQTNALDLTFLQDYYKDELVLYKDKYKDLLTHYDTIFV